MNNIPYDKAPLPNELARETTRVADYKKTYDRHNAVHFNSGRALLVEVCPNGIPVQSPEHELARNNIVDELVRHFFHLPANGTFKHVYYNTTNPVEEPQPGPPPPPVDINEMLIDESEGAGHAPEVNAMIGAILKLFHKNKINFEKPNDIDQKLKHAFEESNAGAPDGPYNDLLCDQNMGITYYYDKLKKMFVSGGFFIAICDCNEVNERKTMRIRASMLVTLEEAYAGGGGGGVPRKLDDIVTAVKAATTVEGRHTKKYVTQRTLPAFQKYPHAGGRFILEALCVYSIPTPKVVVVHGGAGAGAGEVAAAAALNLSGRSMGVFDFIDPLVPTKIASVISGQTCLRFLDTYACLHGIPEVKLESVLRSYEKTSVQGEEFVFAPKTEPGVQMPDFFAPGDWVHYKLTGTGADWFSGVVNHVEPDAFQMKVRRWNPMVGDFESLFDTVPVYFKDEQNRFLADIRPGQNVSFRISATRRSAFKDGIIVKFKDGQLEWIVRDTDGYLENVTYNVRKFRGTSTERASFLHEYYYMFGYDFEESETIYSLLTLRKVVTYHPEAWYDPRNIVANQPLYAGVHTPIRQNLGPDDKEDRENRLQFRIHEKTPIYPVQAGSQLPVPTAYAHPLENRDPKDKTKMDKITTRMESYLIPMVRRVTGVYKPRGEVVNKISLLGSDGKPQPTWRHLQSTVLQAVATDRSDHVNREAWHFRFGILNNPTAIIGPVPLGIAAGTLYERGSRHGITHLSARNADRVRAALAVGTVRLQHKTAANQKRAVIQRIWLVARRMQFRQSVEKYRKMSLQAVEAAAEHVMPEAPQPYLSPERARELERTPSVKSSELQRAVSVTLPSKTSTPFSTTTIAPTQGHSMSYEQLVHNTGVQDFHGGAGRVRGRVEGEEALTPRREILRSRDLPEDLVRMLMEVRQLSTMLGQTDYDDMRRRAMQMLDESGLDEALREEIIQSFDLRFNERTAHVLLTSRQKNPVLLHTQEGGELVLGHGGSKETVTGEEAVAAVPPPSRRQTRLVPFNLEEHGITRLRDPIPALRGKLLEDVRGLCDSLYTVLADLQGASAGKGEKWFANAANNFIRKAIEYFKILNKKIVSKLALETRTFALQIFQDLEFIADNIGYDKHIRTMAALRDTIERLMNKISLMDEHVVFSFADEAQTEDEEAWMNQTPAPNAVPRPRVRVVRDEDEEEEQPQKALRLALPAPAPAPAPAPVLPPVLPPVLFPQLQQEVIEIDDDGPAPAHFEYDSDIELLHDTKNPHFGKNKHKRLQTVRRRP
jgi:hypothetical protein